jgi:hypothetical protein
MLKRGYSYREYAYELFNLAHRLAQQQDAQTTHWRVHRWGLAAPVRRARLWQTAGGGKFQLGRGRCCNGLLGGQHRRIGIQLDGRFWFVPQRRAFFNSSSLILNKLSLSCVLVMILVAFSVK